MRSVVVLFVPLLVFTPLSFDSTSRPASTPDSTGTITGTVVDASGGAPLAGVNVSIDSLQIGDATGPKGRFRLPNVPAGTHEVSAAFVGYSSAQKTVSVEAGKTTQVFFTLSPTTQQKKEFLMTEQAPAVQRRAPAARADGQVRRRPRPSQRNTEDYAPIESNDFRAVRDHPLSTFSIDVDGASYTNTRRFIRDGERPLTHERAETELSPDFHFAAAVAGYGMLLRDSEYKGALTLDAVRRLAEQGRGDDPNGTRAGFISLVEDSRGLLAGGTTVEDPGTSQ